MTSPIAQQLLGAGSELSRSLSALCFGEAL
jgi:hypothetical protein